MVITEIAKKKWLFLALFIVLGLGAFFRLYRISEYMTFLGDEGRDMLVVKRMIVDHKFTLLGPTASVGGFFMGPIYYYFMAPFLWLWKLDPTGPAVMVALFGVATIYVIYVAGKNFFGIREGLIAALLYAISPQIINYSRSSWNPNIVPFFSILLIYVMWDIVAGGNWFKLFWVGVIFGIGLQLHYTFIFLGLVTIIYLSFYVKEGLRIRDVLGGIAGFVIGWGPFLAFELRHGFPNTISIYRFLLSGKDTGFSATYFIQTISDVTGRLFGRLLLSFPESQFYGDWIVGLVIVIILATVIFSLKRRISPMTAINEKRALILCGVWYLGVTVLFGLYRKGIYDYYFGIYYALPSLLVAYVLGKLSRYKRGLGVAIISGSVVAGNLLYQTPLKFEPNNQLGQTKFVTEKILERVGNKRFNFALITGQNSDHAYRYFMEIWGWQPVVIENETNDPERKTITDQLLVLCEQKSCRPLGHPSWEIAGFGRAQIEGEWDVTFMKIYKLSHYDE